MELDYCGARTLAAPSLDDVFESLSELVDEEGRAYLVLAVEEQVYIQALKTKTGFYVEHRAGSKAEHFGTARRDLSLDEVKMMFACYYRGDASYQDIADFKPDVLPSVDEVTLVYCGEMTLASPSLDDVVETLSRLTDEEEGASLVLNLEHGVFIQILKTDKGLYVEYCTGSEDEHFGTSRSDLSFHTVRTILERYYDADPTFRDVAEFQPGMPIEPGWFARHIVLPIVCFPYYGGRTGFGDPNKFVDGMPRPKYSRGVRFVVYFLPCLLLCVLCLWVIWRFWNLWVQG
jgi:hypothetical protein